MGKLKYLNIFWVFLVLISLFSGFLYADDPQETIKIGGTGGAYGIMEKIAQVFEKEHPKIKIVMTPSLGSTGGIKAVLAGAINLGLSGRLPDEAETKQGAVARPYGRTPFGFATRYNPAGFDCTTTQMAAIYAGEIKNWPDGMPIRLVMRPLGDIETALIKNMSAEMAAAMDKARGREGLIVAKTDLDNTEALEDILGTIGATTLAQIMSENRNVRLLPFNGIAPTLANLASGAYPYYRQFFFITGPRSSAATRQFIDFVTSPAGAELLQKNGHLVEGPTP